MSTVTELDIATQAVSDPPRVIAPERATIFADRARRFAALAEGHALGDWLQLLGRITQAQHAALQVSPVPPVADFPAVEQARQHGMPPVLCANWPRDPIWRDALRQIVTALKADPSAPVREHCAVLTAMPPEALELLADKVLRNEFHGPDSRLLPYVAAALQVYWTVLAAALGAGAIPMLDVPGVCPCCGSLPVASVVRVAPEINNLRYLHCSLCNTEWHLVRAKCAACDATGKVGLRQLEGSSLANAAAMRAEICDDCKSYLKILYQDKALGGDPVADDLATLALDILVDAAGYSRAGPNLLLMPGDV